MNIYLRYLVYALLFIVYLFLCQEWLGDVRAAWLGKQTNPFLFHLVSSMIDILLGFLIGAETLRQSFAKKGKWGLNLPKLVGFCLPILLVAVLPTLIQFGYLTSKAIPVSIITPLATMVANVAFGYGLITSVHKK
jgi:hypothetical protein